MKTNKELYGEQLPMDIPQEVIDDRVFKLARELDKEQKLHYIKRRQARVTKLVRAIEFWRNINEC